MRYISRITFSILGSILIVIVISTLSGPVKVETPPVETFSFEKEFERLSKKDALDSQEYAKYQSLIAQRNEFHLRQMRQSINPESVNLAKLKQLNFLNIPLALVWGLIYFFSFRRKSDKTDLLILCVPLLMVIFKLITLQLFLFLFVLTLSVWIYLQSDSKINR